MFVDLCVYLEACVDATGVYMHLVMCYRGVSVCFLVSLTAQVDQKENKKQDKFAYNVYRIVKQKQRQIIQILLQIDEDSCSGSQIVNGNTCPSHYSLF